MSKSARCCGAKYISKSKCTKHTIVGPLLEVAMSKKCTPLWCEAHFQSQNVQTHQVPDHFWKLRCRKSARRCGAKHISKSKCTKHTMLGPLLEFRCRKSARRCGAKHISKSNVQNTRVSDHFWRFRCWKKCTLLWREAHFEVTLHYSTYSSSTLTTLNYTTPHYITLNDTATQIDR